MSKRKGLTISEIEEWAMNDEGIYDWWRSTKQSKRDFIRQYRAEIEAAINNVTSGRKRAHYLVYDKPKGPVNGGLGGLDGMRYTTDFSKAFNGFFDWCLEVFLASLDPVSEQNLRTIIRSRRFQIRVTVHHREIKLWEQYATRQPGRIFAITRTSRIDRGVTRNIVRIVIPAYTLFSPTGLSTIFIHEFIHTVQHYKIWRAEQARQIPKGGAFTAEIAEADAEAGEKQFAWAVWSHVKRSGGDMNDRGAADAIVVKAWNDTVSPEARAAIEALKARYR